jgi:hypothetical protein
MLFCFVSTTCADSNKKPTNPKSPPYPEGNILFCEVKYRISFMDGRFEDRSFEPISPYAAIIPIPAAGHTIVVDALRNARRFLWDQWKTELERLKKVTDRIDDVWFLKTEYWTNETTSRPKVTKFIRIYVAPPILGPGQDPGIPDTNLTNPPSNFCLGLSENFYDGNF